MHLIKKVKHLCTKNYVTLMKETEEDTSGEIFHAHRLEEFTLSKSLQIRCNLYQNSNYIFYRNRTNSAICMDPK